MAACAETVFWGITGYDTCVNYYFEKSKNREGHGRLAHWPLKITGGPVRREDSGTMAIGIAEPGGDGAG